MIDYKKMVDTVAKAYISQCTNEKLFNKGKISNVYFMVRATLLKKEYTEIKSLHDYICSLKERQLMSLSDLFSKAEIYRRDQFISRESIEEVKTERYNLDKLLSM